MRDRVAREDVAHGRLRRWASAVLVACIVGLVPAMLLLKAALMLVHDRHVRRGVVIHAGSEARWAAVSLVAWAVAIPAYGWFEGRRRDPHRRTRRALVVPLAAFVILFAVGFACRWVAWVERGERRAQEAEGRRVEVERSIGELPPEWQEKTRRTIEGRE